MKNGRTDLKRVVGIVRRVAMRMALLATVSLLLPACGRSSPSGASATGNTSAPPPGPTFSDPPPEPTVSDPPPEPTFSDPVIETFPNEGRDHVPVGTAVVYQTDPPTSGNHYPSPQSGGYFDVSIAAGFLVHSLEHGGVVVYYNPATLSTPQKDSLKSLADAHPGIYGQVVCVPRNDAQYPLILTAWTHRLQLTVYDQTRIDGFLTLFLWQGPESAPEAPWGDPLEDNTTATPIFTPTAYLRIQDDVRPGSLWTSSGDSYTAAALTISVDFRVTAISAAADTAAIEILDPTTKEVLARASYDAATGQLTFSIGATSFAAVTLTTGAYQTVTFEVDSAQHAQWSVTGSAATPALDFSAPSVGLGLSAAYAGGSAAAPDFYFGNIQITQP